jgi:hypothetical protein
MFYFAGAFRKRGSALPLLQGIKSKHAADGDFASYFLQPPAT